MHSWLKHKVVLGAVALAWFSASGPAFAEDSPYLKHIRRQAEAQVRNSPRLKQAISYVFGCNTDCQIEKRFREIRDAPVGSIGIRG